LQDNPTIFQRQEKNKETILGEYVDEKMNTHRADANGAPITVPKPTLDALKIVFVSDGVFGEGLHHTP
jgi:hypothetical protein